MSDADMWAFKNLGIVYEANGLHEQAENAYDTAIHLGCQEPFILIHKARMAHKRGRYETAIESCKKILGTDPYNWEALVEVSDRYVSVMQYENAISSYRKAQKYISTAVLTGKLVVALISKGDYDSAMKKCDEGIA